MGRDEKVRILVDITEGIAGTTEVGGDVNLFPAVRVPLIASPRSEDSDGAVAGTIFRAEPIWDLIAAALRCRGVAYAALRLAAIAAYFDIMVPFMLRCVQDRSVSVYDKRSRTGTVCM